MVSGRLEMKGEALLEGVGAEGRPKDRGGMKTGWLDRLDRAVGSLGLVGFTMDLSQPTIGKCSSTDPVKSGRIKSCTLFSVTE